ncbi:MAG: response regulator [Chloroflexota bacterium]
MLAKRILIVDDADDWRDLLQASLRRLKYDVDTAADFDEAVERLDYAEVELVVVDLRLDPADEDNRDGMKLLAELNRRSINALVVTGIGNMQLRSQAISFEAITFIEKSLISRNIDTLREVVERIFNEMETRDEKRATLTEQLLRGQAVGFPSEAAGYPLREPLSDALNAVLNKSI